MKHNRYLVLGLFLSCLLCGLYLYSCFAPPTNTPCTPIEYATGDKLDVDSGKIYTFETNDAYADVLAFYEAGLKTELPPEDNYGPITWDAFPIGNNRILFVCSSILDGYTSEIGCIYVRERTGEGVIEITWSYQLDGPAKSCDVLPGIEPEDYLQAP